MDKFINVHVTYFDKDKKPNTYSYMISKERIAFVEPYDCGKAFVSWRVESKKPHGLFVDETYEEVCALLNN